MKKPLVSLFALAMWAAVPAGAAVCALDIVPATTLLLPFFEVDLSKINKPKRAEVTTVTLTNHADSETLVHVTFWTDVALPVLAYDIPMPPFGSQDIPLHDIYRGEISELPGIDPENPGVAPPGVTTEDVIARQTGKAIDGECLTFPRGDNIARGYITFDVVGTNGNVFSNRRGRADHLNVLTGVVTYNNRRRKNGSLEYLVHLEQSEGLGSVWALDYDIGSGSRTEVIVWREAGEGQSLDRAALCDGPSDNGWYPHNQVQVAVADREGNMQEILVDAAGDSIPGFPLAAGRYEIARGGIAVPYKSGTMYLDLSNSAQSWVGLRRSFSSTKRQGRGQAVPVVPIGCTEE